MSDFYARGAFNYRQFTIKGKVCEAHQQHKHNYDHMTIIQEGEVRITIKEEGKSEVTVEGKPGSIIFVGKNAEHLIKPLTPVVRYTCMFACRDHNGLVCDVYQGNVEAAS